MARSLFWVAAWALWSGCTSQEATQAPYIGFPVLPPVEGADPSIRRKQTIEIPTKLIVKRDGNQAIASFDPRSLKAAEIDVGKMMVIGTRTTMTVLPDEEHGIIGLYDYFPTEVGDSLEVGPGAVEVQIRVEVFETDIPAQHRWQPTSGKYRVLGEWRLRATVLAR